MKNRIIIKGAREHNLKNIDIEIPRDKIVVITGLSGSGKSSLVFGTIAAFVFLFPALGAYLPFEQLPPATINHRLDAGGAPARRSCIAPPSSFWIPSA